MKRDPAPGLACGWHKPWGKSYMHFEYASELLHENGVVQKLCTECHHWWWPQEFGSEESDSQKVIRPRKKSHPYI